MHLGFHKEAYFGVIFDIHDFTYNKDSGLKFLKTKMLELLSKAENKTKAYVAGYENLPKTHGESIAQIENFHIQHDYKLDKYLKDVLSGVGLQEDVKKYIFIFTNKYSSKSSYSYKNILRLNEVRQYNCKYYIFEFLKSSVELQNIVESHNENYFFINDMEYLSKILHKIEEEIKNGWWSIGKKRNKISNKFWHI